MDHENGASETATTGMSEKQILDELQLHKLKLEMQNQELRRTIANKGENEAHLHNIITNTPAGYFHLDLEDRFVNVNDAWLHMLGYNCPDEVIGKHFSMVMLDTESDSMIKHFAELHSGKPVPIGALSIRRKDGSFGNQIFSAHPVLQTGNIIGFEWFIIDLSERGRLEEEKIELERQAQLAQNLENLGVLAGGIVHDFNNILSIIIGNCSMALQRPDMTGKLIPEIGIAAVRASDLCRQMLAYAGRSSNKMKKVMMTTLLDDLVIMLKETINRNVVITSSFSDDLPVIKGDAGQIRQVVMTLVLNASESIGEAKGEISVSLNKISIREGQSEKDNLGKLIPPGWYVCLEVIDNGRGMDTETRYKIFEPFYTTKFTGRGLSMCSVLGIIRSHKGVLQLYSKLGQGSTFKVYLPVLDDASTGVEPPKQVAQLPWQGRGTILLVEDEVQLLAVGKALLKTMGFSVIEASNGIEALELYHKNAAVITLVLTDIAMPLMDGYELCHELRKINTTLPIIVTSGFSEAEFTSRLAQDDIAGLISKPYNFDQLWEVLRGVLESGLHNRA